MTTASKQDGCQAYSSQMPVHSKKKKKSFPEAALQPKHNLAAAAHVTEKHCPSME